MDRAKKRRILNGVILGPIIYFLVSYILDRGKNFSLTGFMVYFGIWLLIWAMIYMVLFFRKGHRT